jgi:hypothetical protein
MRGVGGQRQSWADETPGEAEVAGKGGDARSEGQRAEFEGEAIFELAQEVVGRQRQKRLGVGAALVPHNAGKAPAHWQDGEGPGGQEMLFGAALVVALVGDGGDDGGHAGVPADHRDLGELAQLRARAVGGDDQSRPEPLAGRKHDLSRVAPRRKLGRCGGDRLDAERGGGFAQRGANIIVERHMRERLVARGLEAQLLEPHRVAHPPVGDGHLKDRLGERRQGCPGAHLLDQPTRSHCERDRAQPAVALT